MVRDLLFLIAVPVVLLLLLVNLWGHRREFDALVVKSEFDVVFKKANGHLDRILAYPKMHVHLLGSIWQLEVMPLDSESVETYSRNSDSALESLKRSEQQVQRMVPAGALRNLQAPTESLLRSTMTLADMDVALLRAEARREEAWQQYERVLEDWRSEVACWKVSRKPGLPQFDGRLVSNVTNDVESAGNQLRTIATAFAARYDDLSRADNELLNLVPAAGVSYASRQASWSNSVAVRVDMDKKIAGEDTVLVGKCNRMMTQGIEDPEKCKPNILVEEVGIVPAANPYGEDCGLNLESLNWREICKAPPCSDIQR